MVSSLPVRGLRADQDVFLSITSRIDKFIWNTSQIHIRVNDVGKKLGNYDLAGALADLIDNSINAKAKNIILKCLFNSGDPIIHIIDDGQGMSREELYAAMRPASKNPMEERSPDDLGRFGWGLKSASFSQCLCLKRIRVRMVLCPEQSGII